MRTNKVRLIRLSLQYQFKDIRKQHEQANTNSADDEGSFALFSIWKSNWPKFSMLTWLCAFEIRLKSIMSHIYVTSLNAPGQ